MTKPKAEKNTKVSVDELLKEKADVENMMSYLEDDYRKANVSEKSYAELKGKHAKKLEEINQKLESSGVDMKTVKKTQSQESEAESEEEEEESEEGKENEEEQEKKQKQGISTEVKEEKPKVGGFLKKIFGGGKREEHKEGSKDEKVKEEENPDDEGPVFVDPMKPPQEQIQTTEISASGEHEVLDPGVEIEKLKVMIEALRETNKTTDETIRTLSESIGEIRSMVFQADASLRESMAKMEKVEDDISEIKPQEITKKFRETNDTLDKQQINMEKIGKKSEDLSEKINKVYEMLKTVGNIENIAGISKDIQKKLEDINEAVKYIERIGSKTEKIFMDLNRSLEDFVIYKARQDDLNESYKDLIKSIDGLNVKFESYVSKKDMESFREDIFLIKKQLLEIESVLPAVQIKMPEEIVLLKRNREDIMLFMESLSEQFRNGKISKGEYESVRRGNKKKLDEIENELRKEWSKFEKFVKIAEKETEENDEGPIPTQETEVTPEEKSSQEEKVEERPEEKKVEQQIFKEINQEKLPKLENMEEQKHEEEKPAEKKVEESTNEKKEMTSKRKEKTEKRGTPKEKKEEKSKTNIDKQKTEDAIKEKKSVEIERRKVRKTKEEILNELKKMNL